MTNTGQTKSLLFALGAVFCTTFLLNVLTPLLADDLTYGATSLSTALQAGIYEYSTWSGRFLFNMINRYFLLAPSVVFNILNAAVFCAFCLLMMVHAAGSWQRISTRKFVITALFCWLCLPAFGETVLWQTGAVTYLWTMTVVLLFLLPYRIVLTRTSRSLQGFGWCALMLLLGLIAGATNEAAGFLAAALALCAATWAWRTYRKVPAWMITGLVGTIIGCVSVAAAPGNRVRAVLIHGDDILVRLEKIADIVTYPYVTWFLDILRDYPLCARLVLASLDVVRTSPLLAVLLPLAVVILWKKYHHIKSYGLARVLLLLSLVSLAFVYYAGYAGRTLFQASIPFMVCVLIIALEGLPAKIIRHQKAILGVTLAVALAIYSFAVVDSYRFSEFSAQRDELAREYVADGIYDIELPLPSKDTKWFTWTVSRSEIADDPEHWINQAYARHVGANSVVAR
jgi:hypothetical protein